MLCLYGIVWPYVTLMSCWIRIEYHTSPITFIKHLSFQHGGHGLLCLSLLLSRYRALNALLTVRSALYDFKVTLASSYRQLGPWKQEIREASAPQAPVYFCDTRIVSTHEGPTFTYCQLLATAFSDWGGNMASTVTIDKVYFETLLRRYVWLPFSSKMNLLSLCWPLSQSWIC